MYCQGILIGVAAAAAMVIILALTITCFLIYKKKKSRSMSEAMELEPDSEHIVFKKQKPDLLKHEMNAELKNKRKISGEFDKTSIKMNKNNQLVNQGT